MKFINANLLKQMYISGANNLYNHYPEVDRLNVFPVPDGDTGMNMNLTFTSGMKEIQNRSDESIYELARAFSKGLLMGARGNSGVITSQIFRGFAEGMKDKKTITTKEFVDCLLNAKEVAYKAVMKPVEGTILTVVRESGESLAKAYKDNMSIEEAMNVLVQAAYASLEHTPELLPVLKEVGVVDSGGTGLWRIFQGMEEAVNGRMINRFENVETSSTTPSAMMMPNNGYAGAKLEEDDDESYGYCTQFIVRLDHNDPNKKAFDETAFRKFLSTHGKSLVIVRDGDDVRVHVHTLTPGNMLNYAQRYGEFVNITIENMSMEHENISEGRIATDMNGNIEAHKAKELPKYSIIAVSSGAGLNQMFSELGVSHIVSGGQTMNPSTQDFLDAAKAHPGKNIIILPNNSNIVMAASQAVEVLKQDGISATLIPTKNIPQGIAACMMFQADFEPEDAFASMTEGKDSIKAGSITYAIKDSDISGVHITKDYYMAMRGNKEIISCLKDKNDALIDLASKMIDEESSGLMLFLGKDVSEEDEKKVTDILNEKYSDSLDVIIKRGDQPIYSYLLGVQ